MAKPRYKLVSPAVLDRGDMVVEGANTAGQVIEETITSEVSRLADRFTFKVGSGITVDVPLNSMIWLRVINRCVRCCYNYTTCICAVCGHKGVFDKED